MNKRSVQALLLAALLALASAGAFHGPWEVEAQIIGVGAQRAPAIDVDRSGTLYLMMSAATKPASAGTPGSQVFLTISRDGGRTWDNTPKTRNLSNSDGEAFGPSLAVFKGGKLRIYAAYHDNEGGDTQVYFLKTKKKTKFKKPANITPHEGGGFSPRVALDPSGAVNIVWWDRENGNNQIAYIRSTDQGETFSTPINISGSPAGAYEPEIAIGPAPAGSELPYTIYVVWEDNASGVVSVMLSRSTDGGQTFSQPKLISSGTARATEPHIATDEQGRVHLAWVDESRDDLQAFYSRSTDGGQTFSDPTNLSSTRNAKVHKTFVVASGNRVYVSYNDDDLRSRQVYLVTSTDGGESFSDPAQVSNANRNIGRGHSAAMVIDNNGMLHIVWIDSSLLGNDEGLLYYSSTPNGRRFEPQKTILAFP